MLDKILDNPTINKLLQRLITLSVHPKKYRRHLRDKVREHIYNHQYKQLLKVIKNLDSYTFFTRNGVGDIFFVASLLAEFKKRNGGHITYLTEKKSLVEYLKAFSAIDEVIYEPFLAPLQQKAIIQRKIEKGVLNFLYFPYRGQKKNYVFADSYANLLGLSLNTERVKPEITEQNRTNAENEFKRLNITPDKTIILIPESVMFDFRVLTPNFWIKLATQLTKCGYNVVFNSKNPAYKKFKNTFLPIMDFIVFAQNAKHIFSFRSGINDLLAGMDISHQTVIYPHNMEVIWADKFLFDELLNKYHVKQHDNELDNILQIYSLNTNFKNMNIREIVLNLGNIEEDLLETLTAYLNT